MTLSIQSIRSFLANQSSSPTLQSGGNTPAVSSANQVQDTYSFSVVGTSRAVGAKEGTGSLELLRARYAAFQDSLPALQDSAVLESNRTNFNIFRNTVERLKEAEKESQATRQETTALPQPQEFEPKLVEKIAGIPIPSTARRQLDPASLLKYSFGESTTNTIVSTFDVQPPPAPQPVTRSLTAEEIAAPVYTPLLPPQPDTTQIGVRDREQQGGFIPTPRQNRLQEDVSTVATGLVPPNQTTGLFPTTTPSIPAANARRSLAIDGEENNNALLQPPGRDNNDRVALPERRTTEQRQNRLGITTEQEQTPVGAPVPPANVAPANNPTAETTLAGATTGVNNLFSLRGTLVRTPTELRQQAIAKQEATTPNADLPLAGRVANTRAQTATGATQGTTEEPKNTT
ncbi:MAG: hypothetical protein HQL55_18140, partial [Magnetococcales bacterium]|nr:hypothetical protein [Magnetococcales bacterium]